MEPVSPRKRAGSSSQVEDRPVKRSHLDVDGDVKSVVDAIISKPFELLSESDICVLIELFNSLEKENVRKAVLPLVKYDSWINLSEAHRAALFRDQPKLESLMNKGLKTYNPEEKNTRYFQVHFLSIFFENTIQILQSDQASSPSSHLQLMIDLLSQLPTRRCVKPLILSKLFTERVPRSPMVDRVNYLLSFPLNDFTAEMLTPVEIEENLESVRDAVRSICWQAGLEEIGLSSSGVLFGSESKIDAFLESMDSEILNEITRKVFFTEIKDETIRRQLFQNRLSPGRTESGSLLPTEQEPPQNTGTKLGLQFLSFQDYFERNLELYKLESFEIVNSAVADTVARLQPEWSSKINKVVLKGSARMGLGIGKFEIEKISRNSIKSASKITEIIAKITIDFKHVSVTTVRDEWENLRAGDVLVLVGYSQDDSSVIRCSSVLSLTDAQGNVVGPGQLPSEVLVGDQRILTVSLDSESSFDHDFNIVVRVKDSHFKYMLSNLHRFGSVVKPSLPDWINDVLIGYGDPADTEGLTIIQGGPGTGKSYTISRKISESIISDSSERILLVGKSNDSLNKILRNVVGLIGLEVCFKPGGAQDDEFNRNRVINHILKLRLDLLDRVKKIAVSMGLSALADDYAYSCENARQMYLNKILPVWSSYERLRSQPDMVKTVSDRVETGSLPQGWKLGLVTSINLSSSNPKQITDDLLAYNTADDILFPFRNEEDGSRISKSEIDGIFSKIESLRPFEILRTVKDRSQYLLTKQARLVAITSAGLCNNMQSFIDSQVRFTSVVIEDCSLMLDVDSVMAILSQIDPKSNLKKVILVGDPSHLPPVVTRRDLSSTFSRSLFERLVRLGVPTSELRDQWRAPHIAHLWRSDLEKIEKISNPVGMKHSFQFVHVDGPESQPMMHFYQNVQEAEFIVGAYMYLRLAGWGREQISILTSYNGQRMLIHDVMKAKCASNPLFGEPAIVTTIDQYQGQENDIVLVSLVRTEGPGHNADVRRLVSALSRARQGVYVFGQYQTYSGVEGGVGDIVNKMAANGLQLALATPDETIQLRDGNHMWRILQDIMKRQIEIE